MELAMKTYLYQQTLKEAQKLSVTKNPNLTVRVFLHKNKPKI